MYEGEVKNLTDNEVRLYVRLTSGQWKDRFGVHKQGIKHREHAKGYELTKHVWKLKDSGKEFSIKWKILEHVCGSLVGGECKLCVTEKLHIITHPRRDILLNSHSDIRCTHKPMQMLASLGIKRGRPRKRVDAVT